MRIRKQMISVGKLTIDYVIKMILDGGKEHIIDVTNFLDNHRIVYVLYVAKSEKEVEFAVGETNKFFFDNYHARIGAFYDEDSNMSVCEFTLGNVDLGLYYDYDINSITFTNRSGNMSNADLSDRLAVEIMEHLLEALANRKKLDGENHE